MPYLLKHPITVVSYDPQWPNLFELEKVLLEKSLDSEVRGIEHIGSTAVAGLEAKPIIDILVGVDDLDSVSRFEPALNRLEYVDAQINPVFQRRLYCKGGYNEGTRHLHFVVYGTEQWQLPLRFRDLLRANEDARREYGTLKQQLALKHQRDLDGYSEDKGTFIGTLLYAE